MKLGFTNNILNLSCIIPNAVAEVKVWSIQPSILRF